MCDKSLQELNQYLDDIDAQIDEAYARGDLERAAELEAEAVFIELHLEEQH